MLIADDKFKIFEIQIFIDIFKFSMKNAFKGVQSDFFNFYIFSPQNFWRFLYHKKAYIFLITHVKFYSWKCSVRKI